MSRLIRSRSMVSGLAAASLGLALAAATPSAQAFTCANCFQEATAHRYLPQLIAAVNAGSMRVVTAIQGAATSQATATAEAGRIVAESAARTAAEMGKNDAALRFEHLDPCSVTAMSRGGQTAATQRPGGGGRGGFGGGAVAKAGAHASMADALDINAGNKPAPTPEVAAALAARGACSTFAKGGVRETGCRDAGFDAGAVSSGFPNADTKAETLFDGPQTAADIGAGLVRKLTVAPGNSPERMAIAAFIRNLETPLDLRTLSRAEINSEAGRNYMALRDSYDAALSMAAKPLRDQESPITANRSTLSVLNQLGKGGDAAYVNAYLDRAYPKWRRDGISYAELLQLEGHRRYLNADWHVRMAAANERQLLSEMVQLLAVNNWMLAQSLEKQQQAAILQGTTAGASLRTEKLPQLMAAHKAARK